MNTLIRRNARDIEVAEMSSRTLRRYVNDFLNLESECSNSDSQNDIE